MRIILVNKYWYARGGAETVALLTKQLLENAGHEVAVFGMSHPKNVFHNDYFVDGVDYENLHGLSAFKFARRFISNSQARRNFAKLVADFKPDVVHLHNIYHQISFSILDVTRAEHIPTVMTLHDYKLISPNYNLYHHGVIDETVCAHPYLCLFNDCMENKARSALVVAEAYWRHFKKYQRAINVFVSPSQFLKNKFVEYGFSENNFSILPNPYSLNAVAAENDNDGYVLYYGRLSKEKGLNILLSAAQKTPGIRYAIAGTGPQEKELKKFALDNNINNVDFLGYHTGARLEDIVSKARLVVLPSVWYENYPMSILGAHARGKIVIASNIGGIPELVGEEFLVPAGDATALAAIVDKWYRASENERRLVGRKLREQIEKTNSPEKYLSNLLNIYASAQTQIKH